MGTPLRVLFVEDCAEDLELMLRALRQGGFDPSHECVENAASMRTALGRQDWDLILSDYTLPNFSGIGALDVLRESALDIPFILVSGTLGDEAAVGAIKAGARDFVPKGLLSRLAFKVQRELEFSEQRRAKARAEDRFRLLSQATNDVLYDWDLRTDVAWMSEQAGTLFRCPPDQMDPVGEWWKSGIHPEDRDRVLGRIERLLRLRETQWSEEYRFRRGDGTYAQLLDRGLISYDPQGKALRWIGSFTDNSQRKELENTLRQAQKMEAVGQLAGGVAHDFNNMLLVISGYVDMLLMKLDLKDPHRRYVEEIRKASERSLLITAKLLAFSRKQVLRAATVDLNALVTNMNQMLQRLIGENIRIRFEPAAGLGAVLADSGQVEQILTNLVLNARDAMSQGGTITIRTANAPEGAVHLQVSDTGQGMTPEIQARIFEPFFTTKGVGQGTGLGLAMAFGTMKQSGGEIRVWSQSGVGSTFTLSFPRHEAAPLPEGMPPAPPCAALRGSETVLLVEDEDMVRALTLEILTGAGYTVLPARDPSEALLICGQEAGEIHLMLTDVVMPLMSGPQLAQALEETRPRMKVLYMSGYTDDAILRHGIARQEVTLLQKPFPSDLLLSKVREEIGKGIGKRESAAAREILA